MAPTTVQAMVAVLRRGIGSTVAASTPARNSSAKGRPNRNRTCVAPTVPRGPVSSFCMALRMTCPAQATTVNTAHNHGMPPAPPTIRATDPADRHSTEPTAAQPPQEREQTPIVRFASPWFDKLTTGLETSLTRAATLVLSLSKDGDSLGGPVARAGLLGRHGPSVGSGRRSDLDRRRRLLGRADEAGEEAPAEPGNVIHHCEYRRHEHQREQRGGEEAADYRD